MAARGEDFGALAQREGDLLISVARKLKCRSWIDLVLDGAGVADTPDVRIDIAPRFALYLDGRAIDVSRPQVRTVLALLATSRGSLGGGELEAALWPAALPANPSAALRTVISRCRSALGDASSLLVADGGSFLLDVETDYSQLRTLVESQEWEVADTEVLLADSEGVAFGGVIDSVLIDERRIEFERLRDRMHRRLVERYATDGRLEDAVQQARKVLDTSPGDEHVASTAARALAKLGRKSHGIELLQRTRSYLISKGLDVAPEFQEVEAEVLASRAVADRLSSVEPEVPSEVFVGREDELSRLTELRPGETVVVEGESGIGKTALLGVYASRSAEAGVHLVRAQGSSTATTPMSALSSLVRGLLQLSGSSPTEQQLPAIALLLPELGLDSPPLTSREALVAGISDFILEEVSKTRAVLAIDDGQWLDLASGLVLEALVRSRRCRLLIFARAGEMPSVLGDAESQVEYLQLGPLDREDSETLVVATAPDLSPTPLPRRLHQWSGGNPFFLQMLVDLAKEEIDLDESLPPIVLDATHRRMEVLSRDSRQVLQKAAVIGLAFKEETITLLDNAARRGIREAVQAGLIEARSDGLCSFRHAIVADAAYQSLGEADRVALHDQVGRLLEMSGSDPITVFAHARKAVTLDPWRAGELALAAATQHVASFQWEEAVEVASWALEAGLIRSRHRLAIAKARAELALGVPNSHIALLDGAQKALEAGDEVALIDAVVELCNSGSVALTGLDVDVVKGIVDAALAAAVDGYRLDELRACVARAFVYSRHGAFGQEQYAMAFANYEHHDRPIQELILRNSEAGLSNPRDFGLAQRATTLLSDAADRSPELRWLSRWFEFRDALIAGDGDRLAWALRDIRKGATDSARRHAFVVLGQTFDMDMQRSWAEATMGLIHEDFDGAERYAQQALETGLEQLAIRGDGFGEGWVMNSYGLLLLAIRRGQGRLDELVEVVETGAPLVPAWRVAIVIANHAAGNIERVRRELDVVTADSFSVLVPDPTWTAATHLLAEPVAKFCDEATIRLLYAMIEPYQDRMSYSGLCTFGPMGESCAILADALGMSDAAALHRANAASQLERLRERSRWGFEDSALA